MYFYCKEQGFSLFELISIIVIVAIICLISLPFYHDWMQKQEFRSIHPMIQQHVSYARSQALARRTTIVICSSESLVQCEKNTWHKVRSFHPWIISLRGTWDEIQSPWCGWAAI